MNKKKGNDKTYNSISVSKDNKEKLEQIMRNLENHHKRNIRIDKALGHLLMVYENIVTNPEQYYNMI